MRLSVLIFLLAVACTSDGADAQTSAVVRARRLPRSYLLLGTVRDSATHRPVAGAQVWPVSKSWGTVTDARGHFQLRWHGRAGWTFIVRLCNGPNLATPMVDFFHDPRVRRIVSIDAKALVVCTSNGRPPWAVDSRDTTAFRGHYIFSWEGGGWLEACGGTKYEPDWDSALGAELRRRQQREGQVSFVRFRGRVAPDHLADNLPPGAILGNAFGSIFIVNRVEEVREARPLDCN